MAFGAALCEDDEQSAEASTVALDLILTSANRMISTPFAPFVFCCSMICHVWVSEPLVVRDSAVWCLGRILERCPSKYQQMGPDQAKIITAFLINAIDQSSRVALQCCWTIGNLFPLLSDDAAEQHVQLVHVLSGVFKRYLLVVRCVI